MIQYHEIIPLTVHSRVRENVNLGNIIVGNINANYHPFFGNLYEILIFKGRLTTIEIKNIESYLTSKWINKSPNYLKQLITLVPNNLNLLYDISLTASNIAGVVENSLKINEISNETSNFIELTKGKVDINLGYILNSLNQTIETTEPSINLNNIHEINGNTLTIYPNYRNVLYLIEVKTNENKLVFEIKEKDIDYPKLLNNYYIIDNRIKIKNNINVLNTGYLFKKSTLIFNGTNQFIIENNIPNCFILIIDNSKFTYLENLNLEKGFYNVNVNENSYIENYITKTKYQTVNNFDLELINNYILKFEVSDEILATNTSKIFIKYRENFTNIDESKFIYDNFIEPRFYNEITNLNINFKLHEEINCNIIDETYRVIKIDKEITIEFPFLYESNEILYNFNNNYYYYSNIPLNGKYVFDSNINLVSDSNLFINVSNLTNDFENIALENFNNSNLDNKNFILIKYDEYKIYENKYIWYQLDNKPFFYDLNEKDFIKQTVDSNVETVTSSNLNINSNIIEIDNLESVTLIVNDNNSINFDNNYENIDIGLYHKEKLYYNSNLNINGVVDININSSETQDNSIARYLFNNSNIGKDENNNYNLIEHNGTLKLFENKYLHFDKTQAYLKTQNLNLSHTEFTVSFWLKINNLDNYRDLNIFTIDNLNIGIKYNFKKLEYFIDFGNNILKSFPYYGNDVNQWNFFTFVVENNNNRKIFKNGELINYDINNEYLLLNNYELTIGNQLNENNHDY